uniref:Small ribosomal subunit protein uS14c n=2 Tax=Psilotum nudum TaxID=3240 RepID=RR14_PSINU|nr:ribosomal protein S14 [Psilotum nudum]Q8WI18.1 RecName: Full=Small ribosomal subunit protein uS14c; AltName: Full=30S ribosomal protein S14, chloroplastic [Psilotum nudum]AGC26791.1 ribosomal protein S14 [Psilotum nudum]BAB84214.1 ribosomal protein S14 [Psilotum nudum]
MAKKSLIEREKKRKKLVQEYNSIRKLLKEEIKKASSLKEKWEIHKKSQILPRNSAPTRLHRRCSLTGRSRSNYRDFGLCRHVLREMAHTCSLPGVTKSSW